MELQIEKIITNNSTITIYNSGKQYRKEIKDERTRQSNDKSIKRL